MVKISFDTEIDSMDELKVLFNYMRELIDIKSRREGINDIPMRTIDSTSNNFSGIPIMGSQSNFSSNSSSNYPSNSSQSSTSNASSSSSFDIFNSDSSSNTNTSNIYGSQQSNANFNRSDNDYVDDDDNDDVLLGDIFSNNSERKDDSNEMKESKKPYTSFFDI